MSYCGLITDRFLFYLAEFSNTTLKQLNISGCNKITNYGLIALCNDKRDRRPIGVDLAELQLELAEGGKPEVHVQPSVSVTSSNSSNGKDAGLWQEVNPFPYSRGCTLLESLELNGVHKVHDAGVVAMSQLSMLQTLSIRNLEHVTDSPLLLLAESCRHLQSLDISGIDMASLQVVEAFADHCYKLETLNCELCNFTSGQFSKVVKPKLPLGIPNGLRSKLEPRPRPILEYNRFVIKTRENAHKELGHHQVRQVCPRLGPRKERKEEQERGD